MTIDGERIYTALRAFSAARGVPVRRVEDPRVGGYWEFDKREIVLGPKADVYTLAHEVAHSLLHPDGFEGFGKRHGFPPAYTEFEASMAAYLVLRELGLRPEVPARLFGLLPWSPELLESCTARVARVARAVIAGVSTHVKQ